MFLLFHDVCKDCLDPVVCYVYSRSFRLTSMSFFVFLHIIFTSFYDDNFTRGQKELDSRRHGGERDMNRRSEACANDTKRLRQVGLWDAKRN